METVELMCDHCGKEYAYPKYELSAHLGKKVSIKCKKCNNRNTVQIDLPLLKGEEPIHTDIHFGETKKRALDISQLIVIDDARNETFNLDLPEGITILGRELGVEDSGKVAITPSDKTVSRNHCQIEKLVENGYEKYVIKDLGSTNGTFINGEQLNDEEEVFLMPGDIVKLGNIEIKVTE